MWRLERRRFGEAQRRPGQEFAERFVFAKLPVEVVALNEETIASLGS